MDDRSVEVGMVEDKTVEENISEVVVTASVETELVDIDVEDSVVVVELANLVSFTTKQMFVKKIKLSISSDNYQMKRD